MGPNKEEDDKEVHVGLRHPISLKISGQPTLFNSFDAFLLDPEVVDGTQSVLFGFYTRHLYRTDSRGRVDLRIKIRIPADNLASIAPQPFPKDK